jgi:hypothetical protein
MKPDLSVIRQCLARSFYLSTWEMSFLYTLKQRFFESGTSFSLSPAEEQKLLEVCEKAGVKWG